MVAQEARVDMRRHDQQAIDTTLHRAQRRRRLAGVTVRTRHEQMQAARARGKVDAANQFRKEFTVQVGQQRADRLRASRDQAARGTVRDVTQLLGHAHDALAGLIGNVGVAVQRA